MMKNTIHEKAIRLIEGGHVEADGHSVRMAIVAEPFEPCAACEMDCLCHEGTEICELCVECDGITGRGCYLILNV